MNTPTQSTIPDITKTTSARSAPLENTPDRWRIDETDSIIIIRDQKHFTANPQPADWLQRIKEYFHTIPDLAALGPKRLTPSGLIQSMGEFIIHPKGFHHLGEDQNATAYRFPEEVDIISTGLLAVDRNAYHRVGGLNHSLNDLAMTDLCLKLRQQSGRIITIPDVAIVISNESSPNPSKTDARAFHDHWGFNWIAPDLDTISAQYAGTGLLWNVRFWGCALPFEKYIHRPSLHWNNYVKVEPYRKRADHLTEIIAELTPQGLIVDLGCGDGLYAHLLALRGREVLGLDPEESAVKQAKQHTSSYKSYPNSPPRFQLANGSAIPIDNQSAQTVFMLDVIEHLPNPVKILTEAARTIKPGGHIFITTPAEQFGHSSDPVYHITEYTPKDLKRQVNAIHNLKVISTGSITGIYRDILIAAQKQ